MNKNLPNSFKLNKNSNLLAYSCFLILFSSLLLGCASETENSNSNNKESSSGVPVSAVEVKSQTLEETLTSVGTLRADRTVQITPEIAAPIEEIHFTEGDTVQEGEILVELDHNKLREQYEATQYSLQEARAQLVNNKRTFDRNKRLHEQDMISSQELDNSRVAYKSSQARVKRLESEVQVVQERLNDATIRAPFTGYLGSREVDAGNYVQPGKHITTLYKLDPLVARFTVPERFAGRLKKGLEVRVFVTSYPNTAYTGKIFFISPRVREETRDLLVKAQVNNSQQKLTPGSFARVKTIVNTFRNSPVVPARALISTRQGYQLFRIVDGVAKQTSVQVGLRKPELVEIREGLNLGETIISSGHMSVSDGSEVSITNSADTGN